MNHRKRLLGSLLTMKSFSVIKHMAKAIHEQEAKRIAHAACRNCVIFDFYSPKAEHERTEGLRMLTGRSRCGQFGESNRTLCILPTKNAFQC